MDERSYRHRTWNDEQLAAAVASSTSISQVGAKLGLRSASAANKTLPKHIRRLGLDASGLVGRQASGNRTRRRYNKVDLDQALVEHSTYASTSDLKARLLEAGILQNVCYECNQESKWNGKKLVLQLDHKNGVRDDNRRENLRLLCPNCHSQTETYAGRNRRHGRLL